MNKKLAIVGAEPSTRENAPFFDETYDIMLISDWAAADWAQNVTLSIEIHKPKIYKNHPRNSEYYEYLQYADHMVLMQEIHEEIPSSVKYPLDEVMQIVDCMKVKGEDVGVFNSSISFAIAYGIVKGYEQIDVYGVEMAHMSEYHSQQPMFTFWTGVAVGKGIKLNVNCTHGLFNHPLYGYEDVPFDDKIHSYINGMMEQQQEIMRQSHMIDGAVAFARQLLEEE